MESLILPQSSSVVNFQHIITTQSPPITKIPFPNREIQYLLQANQQNRKPATIEPNRSRRRGNLDTPKKCQNLFSAYDIPHERASHFINPPTPNTVKDFVASAEPLVAPVPTAPVEPVTNNNKNIIESNDAAPWDDFFAPPVINKPILHVYLKETLFRAEKANQLNKFEFTGTIGIALENTTNLKDDSIITIHTELMNDKAVVKELLNMQTKQIEERLSLSRDIQTKELPDYTLPNNPPITLGTYTCIDTFRPMIMKAKTMLKPSQTNTTNSHNILQLTVNLLFNVQYFPHTLHQLSVKVSLAGVLNKLPASFTVTNSNNNKNNKNNNNKNQQFLFDAGKGLVCWTLDNYDPTTATLLELSAEINTNNNDEEGEGEGVVESVGVSLPVSVKAEYEDILLTTSTINTSVKDSMKDSMEMDIRVKKKSQMEYRFF